MKPSMLKPQALLKIVAYTLCIGSLVSCSWITSRRSIFGEEEKSADGAQADAAAEQSSEARALETVPKEQYDQLLNKYEALLQQNREADHIPQASPLAKKTPEQLVSELYNAKTTDSSELLDVAQPAANVPVIAAAPVSEDKVNAQIEVLKMAQALLAENRFDEALAKAKQLTDTPVRQINVQAKFIIGEILFRQQEYDLAMQVFEDIAKQQAFSSIVVKVLGRLVVCSEKLKLNEKRERYYSLLHDFFES